MLNRSIVFGAGWGLWLGITAIAMVGNAAEGPVKPLPAASGLEQPPQPMTRRLPAVMGPELPPWLVNAKQPAEWPAKLPPTSPAEAMQSAVHFEPGAGLPGQHSFALANLPAGQHRDHRVEPVLATEPMPPPPEEAVSLHLNEVDVRQTLEILSRSHRLNILVAPGVQGQVTANLEGLTVDQALNAILKLCNLVAHREEGLIYVYSGSEYPQQDLRVGVFPLDYISSIDIMPVVQSLLSPVGQVFTTEVSDTDNRRTQEAIVVTDAAWVLQRVEDYVLQMDQAPRQVMIEANVLQIILGDDCEHGVNYKHAAALAGTQVELDMAGFVNPVSTPAVFARIKGEQIDGLLKILKTTTDARTLASPRLLVINGQRARIQIGEQLGYKVVTVTETAAVEEVKFLEIGVVLEVTPRISRDGRVLMRVKPEVSDGVINPETLLPEEETSELESDVLLADGQGVVIGGLIQEKDVATTQKLPFLGDVHLIGKLFQRHKRTKERSEVVITLVPRIIHNVPPITDRDAFDAMRADTRLFEGPLCPVPRPWLPQLPDAINNPHYLRHGWRQWSVCDRCQLSDCQCESDVKPSIESVPYTDGQMPPTPAIIEPYPDTTVYPPVQY